MQSRWMSVKEAADHAAVSVETVRRAARAGRLKGLKVNAARIWRTRREWVDEWLGLSVQEVEQ